MSTDLSTEVKSASDIISDKIKAEFVNLIPDDKWKELVAKEIERYTTQKRNNYDGKMESSPFETLVGDIIKKMLSDKIQEQLKTLPSYINDDAVLEGMVLKIAREAGKGFVDNATNYIAQRVLMSIRSNSYRRICLCPK